MYIIPMRTIVIVKTVLQKYKYILYFIVGSSVFTMGAIKMLKYYHYRYLASVSSIHNIMKLLSLEYKVK